MVNDTTRLLGLDGLVAERVELDAADTSTPLNFEEPVLRRLCYWRTRRRLARWLVGRG
jgi:hypothetical protein